MEDFKIGSSRRHNPRFLTCSEAGEIMGLSAGAILYNVKKGYLVAEFDGFRYKIRPSDLRQFAEDFYYE